MSDQKRIEKVISSLDLGYSDIYQGDNVRELTMEAKLDTLELAAQMKDIDEAINFSVFSSLGAKHPSAEIYSIDFPSDFRASIYLLLGGYYRQAILCLRNWFEIRLAGIYYGFVSCSTLEYESWKSGTAKGVFGRTLIHRLFARAEFQKADRRLNLKHRLKKLYLELSAFTHGAGLGRYDLQSETDNVPRFNSHSVDLWFNLTSRVFSEVVICFLQAYSKNAISSLEKKELKCLYRMIPSQYQEELKSRGIF